MLLLRYGHHMTNVIWTSRSQIEDFERCPRLCYWRYHYNGIGLEGHGIQLEAEMGTAIHTGIEVLLQGYSVDTAVHDATVYINLAIAKDPTPPHLLTDNRRFEYEEAIPLVEACVRGWALARLPRIVTTGKCLSIEREHPIKFTLEGGQVVGLQTRPDIVWQRTADNAVFIRNIKTCKVVDDKFRQQWKIDMQTLSEPLAVEQTGVQVSGVIVEGVAKGKKLDFPASALADLAGKYYHNNPLIYGWHKEAEPPLTREDWCIAPHSKILRADMSWCEAWQVRPGDELVGFDQELGSKQWPKLRKAYVTATTTLKKPSLLLMTDQGEVTCSVDHLWPVRRYHGKLHKHPWSIAYQWVEAGKLKLGEKIPFLGRPWEVDTSWEAGYVSGLLDGEGSIHSGVTFYQNPGIVLDSFLDLMSKYNIHVLVNPHKTGFKGSKGRCMQVRILGGTHAGMRMLGLFRPKRLLRGSSLWEGRRVTGAQRTCATIRRIELLGDEQDLVGIETTTGTMVVNGLLSHNSHRYEWTDLSGQHRRLGKGYRKVPVWRAYPGGVAAWINHVWGEDASAFDDLFVELEPILRSDYEIERWKRQTLPQIQQREIAALSIKVMQDAGDPMHTAEPALDEYFPMHTSSGNCIWPRRCTYWSLCHGTAAADPLGSGEFQPRVPHHPVPVEEP